MSIRNLIIVTEEEGAVFVEVRNHKGACVLQVYQTTIEEDKYRYYVQEAVMEEMSSSDRHLWHRRQEMVFDTWTEALSDAMNYSIMEY